MIYKWIGAIFIITSCGGFGFAMASGHKRTESQLKQVIQMLEFMESELQYRLTPLPELCRAASRESGGMARKIMQNLEKELQAQISPDVGCCMTAAIQKSGDVPAVLRKLFLQLGHSLGRFDLPGQVRGLRAVRTACEGELKRLGKNADIRMRSYQTLGLCAGAALAILFA